MKDILLTIFLTYVGKVLPRENSKTFGDYKAVYNLQHTMNVQMEHRHLGGGAFAEVVPYEKFDFIVRILTTGHRRRNV